MAAFGARVEAGDFAVGRCPDCRREVLTYADEDRRDGGEARRCVHCDGPLNGEPRWIDAADLAALGYEVDSGRGEGGGCTACSSGGCAVQSVNERRGVR
ncbi:MAG: hypothetical protein HYY35_02295 [Deltaproteobacteria bacterium]|nr:hypothetical protein [Deltaproteobacteria bacterium]